MIHHGISSSYGYNNGQWIEVKDYKNSKNMFNQQDLKIGEYNILFGFPNCILNKFSRNKKRFQYIVNEIIPNSDVDVLSLLEVTREFMNVLLSNDFIKDNYYVSHISKMYEHRLFESVVISKFPFFSIFTKDERGGRYQYSMFGDKDSIDWKSCVIISGHLWAGEHDYKSREKQMELINHSLITNSFLNHIMIPQNIKVIGINANKYNNIILQGDLNMHMRHEDSFIYKNNFIDLYREIYPNENGYTWDPTQNSLLKTVFLFDNRKMRLDRILMRNQCSLFNIQEVEILGKQRIGIGLCSSDHYYLFAHLSINSQPKIYQQKYDTSNIIMEKSTGFRSINRIISIRKKVAVIIGLTVLLLAVGIPLLVIFL